MEGSKDERIRRSSRQLLLCHDGSVSRLHRNSLWHYSCGWLGVVVRNDSCRSHLAYQLQRCGVEAVGLGSDELWRLWGCYKRSAFTCPLDWTGLRLKPFSQLLAIARSGLNSVLSPRPVTSSLPFLTSSHFPDSPTPRPG